MRTWVIGSHHSRTTCLQDPFELQSVLQKAFRRNVKAQVSDYLVASDTEIRMEAATAAAKRGGVDISCWIRDQDLSPLLTASETRTKQGLDAAFMRRFNALPSSRADLVYFLGDSAEYQSWSAVSHMIPTYRVNSKASKYWLPAQRRWMTGKERLCSMGFPCTKEIADSMHVPALGATDVARAADMCGNAMHFQVCGIMQLLALVCFGPAESKTQDVVSMGLRDVL